jgi:hypothetical protein
MADLSSLISEVLRMAKDSHDENRRYAEQRWSPDEENYRKREMLKLMQEGKERELLMQRNTDLERQGLVNSGQLDKQGLENTGALSRQGLMNTGNMGVAKVGLEGQKYTADKGLEGQIYGSAMNKSALMGRKDLEVGVDKWVKSTSDDLQKQYDLASADSPKAGTKEDLAYQEKLLRIKNLRANLTDFLTKGKDAARQGIDLTGDFDIYKDRYINNPELLQNNAGGQQAASGSGKKKKTLVYNPAKGSFE